MKDGGVLWLLAIGAVLVMMAPRATSTEVIPANEPLALTLEGRAYRGNRRVR